MSIKRRRNILYDPSLCYPEEVTDYESYEFTVPTSTTDWDTKVNVSGAFTIVSTARFIEILTDADIRVKFNATTNHSILITAVSGKLTIEPVRERLAVTNIYFTNPSATTAANIKLKLT